MTIKVNGQEINYTIFNGGEVHLSVPEEALDNPVDIEAGLYSSDDIMALAMVTDSIKRQNPMAKLALRMPYLPYARQDRVCNPGEALGVAVMADMINAMNFDMVLVHDCHSDVGTALLNNTWNKPPEDIISNAAKDTDGIFKADILEDLENVVLVSPDAGAEKKVFKVAESLGIDKVLLASKVRDVKSGNIVSTSICNGDDDELFSSIDYKYLVVDDLCDGGRTFVELGKVLNDKYGLDKTQLRLYVTHGIFAKGFEDLSEYYEVIYCHNLLPDVKDLHEKEGDGIECNIEYLDYVTLVEI